MPQSLSAWTEATGNSSVVALTHASRSLVSQIGDPERIERLSYRPTHRRLPMQTALNAGHQSQLAEYEPPLDLLDRTRVDAHCAIACQHADVFTSRFGGEGVEQPLFERA